MGNNVLFPDDIKLEKKSLRDIFGDLLVVHGSKSDNIVVVDADLSSSTRTIRFAEHFPDRFFNVGIAEQNAVGIAAGLANAGKTAVVSGFTCFTVGRGWEIIRCAAYDHLNLKICTTHAGLSAAKDGGSHQALEDMALIMTIPKVEAFAPCSVTEMDDIMEYILYRKGVKFVRLVRERLPALPDGADPPNIKGIRFLYGGKKEKYDFIIVSTGSASAFTPYAAHILEKKYGLTGSAVHICRIKPLTPELIDLIRCAYVTVTVEEHNIYNGFGAVVCRIAAGIPDCFPILTLGINDSFGMSGNYYELLEGFGLSPGGIANSVKKFIDNLGCH